LFINWSSNHDRPSDDNSKDVLNLRARLPGTNARANHAAIGVPRIAADFLHGHGSRSWRANGLAGNYDVSGGATGDVLQQVEGG
jgi:hypothetical protein